MTFENGKITFYNNGWEIIIELYKLPFDAIEKIHNAIFDKINNWSNYEVGFKLYFGDKKNPKEAVECINVNRYDNKIRFVYR